MGKLGLFLLLIFNSFFIHGQDSTLSRYELLNSEDTLVYSPIILDEFENYRFKHRDFNASSGNIGLPTYYLDSLFLVDYNGFFNGYSNSLFSKDQMKFYTQEKDLTLLQYVNGAQSEQYFRVLHSNQFGKGLNISFDYNRIISEGFYLNQLTDNTHFNTSLNFNSRNSKYQLKAFYLISNLKVQENGGIQFSDSADENLNNSDLLNVKLSSASQKMRSQSVLVHQNLKMVDSSIIGAIRLIQESELAWSWKWYKDNGVTDFYQNIFYDSTKTFDSIHAHRFRNAIGLSLFDNQLKLKYEYQYHGYSQDSIYDTLYTSDFVSLQYRNSFNRFSFDLMSMIGLSGYNSGDYSSSVGLSYRIDSSSTIRLLASTQSQSPFYWQNRYNGNHLVYSNEFINEELTRLGVDYQNKKYKGSIGIQHVIRENPIYFNSGGSSSQLIDQLSITQFSLNKNFKFGNFYWNNIFNYQINSNDSILPLPSFMSSHTLYYENTLFKSNLLIQLGATYKYISKYKGYGYFPENAAFVLQENSNLGGFGYLDIFFKFRIQHARVFAKLENLLGDQFQPDGMMINDYPIPGRAFKIGLSWALFN